VKLNCHILRPFQLQDAERSVAVVVDLRVRVVVHHNDVVILRKVDEPFEERPVRRCPNRVVGIGLLSLGQIVPG